MRVVKNILITAVLLVIVLVAVAYVLPAHYRVSRSLDIGAPASKIYPLVAETRAWKQWSAWNARDPNMDIVYSGPDRGAGAKWAWHSKSEGNGEMTFTAAEIDRRLDYSLYFPDFDSRAAGVIVFEAITPNTTRVTWSNEGDLGNNPMMRWMGLAMDHLVGNDFAAGLENLQRIASR